MSPRLPVTSLALALGLALGLADDLTAQEPSGPDATQGQEAKAKPAPRRQPPRSRRARPAEGKADPSTPVAKADDAEGKDAEKAEGKDAEDKDGAEGKDAEEAKEKGPKPGETTEKATFGSGCFWCGEAVFERIKGVKNAVSGYAGGTVPNPTYEQVCTGLTGHAECFQVEYDPAVVSYETLLKVFFSSHDPTTLNAQGPDFGTQYRSVIFYHDEEQKKTAEAMYREMTARKIFRNPIVTELVPYTIFYPAEPYHQDYFKHNKYSQYSQMFIAPKLRKLKLPK